MVDNSKQRLKKFLRNYTEVVAVAAGLLLVLLLLVLFRILALISIGDLSNINPLITSGQNKLVLKDGTSEIIKIPIDTVVAKGSSGGKTTNGTTNDTSAASTNTTGSGGSTGTGSGANSGSGAGGGTTQTGAGSGSGSGTGGGSGNPIVTVSPSVSPSSSPSPVPTIAAFTASISPSVSFFIVSSSSYFGGCKITYNFTFTILAQNSPGVVKAQWRWPGSDWGNEFNVSFSAGQTSAPVSLEQYVSGPTGPQTISLRLNSPNSTTKNFGFTHQC